MTQDLDMEEVFFKDVFYQLMYEKNKPAYVYNKNILERIKKEISDLDVEKKDFYWIVKRKTKNDKMLKTKDVCEIFHLSRPTLDNWIKLGCPVHIIGNKKYFMQNEIEEWIKSK